MRILTVPALLAGLLLGTPAPAAAHETPADAAPTESHWYGGRILLADGAALGLAIASFNGRDSLLMAKTAWLSFVVAPPVMHALHGNLHRGLISAALRACLPLGLATLLYATASCRQGEWFCGVGEWAGGFLLGGLTASIVDQILANDDHPVPTEARRSFAILPTLQPARGGATAGLVGVF